MRSEYSLGEETTDSPRVYKVWSSIRRNNPNDHGRGHDITPTPTSYQQLHFRTYLGRGRVYVLCLSLVAYPPVAGFKHMQTRGHVPLEIRLVFLIYC